jgi:hypothetical protein
MLALLLEVLPLAALLSMVLAVVVVAVPSLQQRHCKGLRERPMQQHCRLVKRLSGGSKLCRY